MDHVQREDTKVGGVQVEWKVSMGDVGEWALDEWNY